MGKIKEALRPLGDMPILEHFLYFSPDGNDLASSIRRAPHLKEPKRKPSKKVAPKVEVPVKFTGGIPVEASENDELWKIASPKDRNLD